MGIRELRSGWGLSTLLIATAGLAAVLGMSATEDGSGWPRAAVFAVLSMAIGLPGIAIGVQREASLRSLVLQLTLTAWAWLGLAFVPAGWGWVMLGLPFLGLFASSPMRWTGKEPGPWPARIRSAQALLRAVTWNMIASVALFVAAFLIANFYAL